MGTWKCNLLVAGESCQLASRDLRIEHPTPLPIAAKVDTRADGIRHPSPSRIWDESDLEELSIHVLQSPTVMGIETRQGEKPLVSDEHNYATKM